MREKKLNIDFRINKMIDLIKTYNDQDEYFRLKYYSNMIKSIDILKSLMIEKNKLDIDINLKLDIDYKKLYEMRGF